MNALTITMLPDKKVELVADAAIHKGYVAHEEHFITSDATLGPCLQMTITIRVAASEPRLIPPTERKLDLAL